MFQSYLVTAEPRLCGSTYLPYACAIWPTAHRQRGATLSTECYHLGDPLRRIIFSICVPFILDSALLADTLWLSRNNEWRLLTKPSTLMDSISSTAKPVRRRTQRCFCCTVSRLRRRCSET